MNFHPKTMRTPHSNRNLLAFIGLLVNENDDLIIRIGSVLKNIGISASLIFLAIIPCGCFIHGRDNIEEIAYSWMQWVIYVRLLSTFVSLVFEKSRITQLFSKVQAIHDHCKFKNTKSKRKDVNLRT